MPKKKENLTETIYTIKTDIALIKQSLLGNPDKNDGIVDKVNKHDMYFYIAYGMIIFLGFAIANVANFVK